MTSSDCETRRRRQGRLASARLFRTDRRCSSPRCCKRRLVQARVPKHTPRVRSTLAHGVLRCAPTLEFFNRQVSARRRFSCKALPFATLETRAVALVALNLVARMCRGSRSAQVRTVRSAALTRVRSWPRRAALWPRFGRAWPRLAALGRAWPRSGRSRHERSRTSGEHSALASPRRAPPALSSSSATRPFWRNRRARRAHPARSLDRAGTPSSPAPGQAAW
jgi:hypothetical protein